MQQFNLVLYIVIISLFQILINFTFSYVMQKTIHQADVTIKTQDYKLFSLILLIINAICFMYSIYYLLVFVKNFLIPAFYDLFLTIQPIV